MYMQISGWTTELIVFIPWDGNGV